MVAEVVTMTDDTIPTRRQRESTRLAATPDAPRLPADVLAELFSTEHWTSRWWASGATLGAATGLALVALRRRSRTAAAASAGVALLAGALGVNAYVGYVPNPEAARVTLSGLGVGRPSGTVRAAGGATHAVQVPAPSRLRMPPTTTWVYTPPGYGSGRRFPVLYLFHGTPGTSADWFGAGQVAHVMDVLVARGLVEPMVVVAPETNGTGRGGRDTEGLDSTTGGSQVETYLTEVVVPWVDERYDTLTDREHRLVGGMSAGAFVALNLGLRHQGTFGQVLALEGFVDPGRAGQRLLATQEQRDANTPSRYVHDLALEHPVRVFVAVGGRSKTCDTAGLAQLATVLRARGQHVDMMVLPGHGHTWPMARTGLAEGLVVASEHLRAVGGPA